MTGVNMKINQGRVDEKASKSRTSFSEVSPQSPCTYLKNGEVKMTKEDKAVLDKIYDKHYGSSAKQQPKAASGETRNALMLKAKEKGIKNFRILNKDELAFVLCDSQSQENIDA